LPGHGAGPLRLIGRDEDIAALRDLVHGLAADGQALLLRGGPGVGKSALLDAAEELALAVGIRVLRASGVACETSCFSGLNQLLLPLYGDLSRLDGLPRHVLRTALGLTAGAASDRLVVANAALALLRQAAAESPLLVIVDDLQWLDQASAQVLRFAARRVRGSPLGIIAAERDGPRGTMTLDIRSRQLRPLNDDTASQLLSVHCPWLAPAVRQRIVAEAHGSPLALLELEAGLSERQRRGAVPLPAFLPVSDRLRDLLSARVAALPSTAGHLLLLAALEGTGELRLLQAAATRSEPEDLILAQRAGLVHVDENVQQVTFTCPAVAYAVLERATTHEITRAHRALAAVLRQQPRRSAWHLAGAATGPRPTLPSRDRSDADHAPRLATAAFLAARVLGNFGVAENLLADAQDASSPGEPAAEIRLATAFLRLHGDGDAAAARALSPESLLDLLGREIECRVGEAESAELIRIASNNTWTGRLAASRAELRRIARPVTGDDGGLLALQATILLSIDAYQSGQWDEATQLARRAATRCAVNGYQLLRREARTVLALVAASRGDGGTAQLIADEIARWAAPRGLTSLLAGARYIGVLTALGRSDASTAYRHCVRICPPGQLSADSPWAAWALVDLVESALRTGRQADAAAHVAAAREAGLATSSPRMALMSGVAIALTAPDDRAPGLFARALATEHAQRWPFDLARGHLLAGERLRRMRLVTAARDHLGTAQDEFRRLGALEWSERAAAARRATGEAPGGRQPGVLALTPQELEIAQLAAAGLSNKEIGGRLFISHRTVASHLLRIFPKLGISSRSALGRVLPPPED
jgi:DNA-binding CsgD family transcriptional regulator